MSIDHGMKSMKANGICMHDPMGMHEDAAAYLEPFRVRFDFFRVGTAPHAL
jgi:hypothetical protein